MKKVCLQIQKKEFDLIVWGRKKTDWRTPNEFNYSRLFIRRPEDNKRIGDSSITHLEFVNGMSKNARRVIAEVVSIRLVRFSADIEIPDDNFRASEGQFAIEIKLGKLV